MSVPFTIQPPTVSVGKSPWAWVVFTDITSGEKRELQVIEWPNGDGYSINKPDGTVEFTKEEFAAVRQAISALGKVK